MLVPSYDILVRYDSHLILSIFTYNIHRVVYFYHKLRNYAGILRHLVEGGLLIL